jgi:thiol-disulfide isomerase/thioredoxin
LVIGVDYSAGTDAISASITMIERMIMQSPAFGAAALVCLTLGLIGCERHVIPEGAPAEQAKPKVSVVNGNDSGITLKILDCAGLRNLIGSQRGKVVVLDVWSTSCPPCVKNFPDLVALHRKFGSERLACISLSLDYEGIGKPDDVAPTVLAFLRGQNATFDNILASQEPETIYKRLGIASIPAVFVFDVGGNMLSKFTDASGGKGRPVYARVEEFVTQLLTEK